MQFLTEKIWRMCPEYGLFNKTVIDNLLPLSSRGAKKALVNRALKHKEILCLKRGLYCLAEPFRAKNPHPFVIAGMLHSPSYVSMESSLRYYGLIPEAVYHVTSVTAKRSRIFKTALGHFCFKRIPCKKFRAGVKNINLSDNVWKYIASPLRAIADLIYLQKKITANKDGMDFFVKSLRIESDDLLSVNMDDFNEIYNSINSRRVKEYLLFLKKELKK
ncbi:MAG: hypothetical protein ABIA63_07080 [bacterium]